MTERAEESPLLDALRTALAGRYEIERELGRGGMATVYLARDVRHRRRVAIKVLDPELSASLGTTRFLREIETAAQLTHPHVVPVHDSGEAARCLYYVMPYVDGDSLRVRLQRDGGLPLNDVLELTRDIAGALDYAHEQGVIHRDIKPENVLLSSGQALVADFGVARAVAKATEGVPQETLTQTGLAVGTPAYMSPEQAAGERDVDRRSDVYSLGCVVYEMLAGVRPFSGTSAEQLAKRFRERPLAVGTHRPGLPRSLDAVCERALSLMPADRFATAGELARALADALKVDTLGSAPTTRAPTRLRASSRRSRFATLALGALCALAAAGWWVSVRDNGTRSGTPELKMLAVLPFKNVGRPEDAYFADGITEELTSRLATLAGLRVIGPTSADQYKGTNKPLKQIAQELNVQYVLRGSVRWEKAGGSGRVRVTPTLIRVDDETQVWTAIYDENAAEVFAVQASIAERVAGALDVALGGRERQGLKAVATRSLEAYDKYWEARQLTSKAEPASLHAAIALLEAALHLDSTFVLAYVQMSVAASYLNALTGDTVARRKAAESMAAAVQLAPDDPAVRLARGTEYLFVEMNAGRAAEQFEFVRQLIPSSADAASMLAYAEMTRGRWVEATRLHEEAVTLDPRSFAVARFAYLGAFITRDSAAARRYIDRMIAIEPENPLGYGSKAVLAATLAANPKEAADVVRETVARLGAKAAAVSLVESPFAVLQYVDSTTQNVLATVTLDGYSGDVVGYYWFKAALHRIRRDRRLERVYADSARRFLEAQRGAGDFRVLQLTLPLVYAALGRAPEAVSEARRTLAFYPVSRSVVDNTLARHLLAEVHTMLGQDDAAVDQLQYLLSVPSNISVQWLRIGVTWDSLRDNARFQQLIANPPR